VAKHQRSIVVAVAAVALALAGCFDSTKSTKQDFAACKLKSLERYPTRLLHKEYEDEQAYYVQICMEAAGYELQCSDRIAGWMEDNCYSRDRGQ
jgi:hypothetical protein